MEFHEPSKLEIWIMVLAGNLLGGSVYRPYVDSLALRGDERVLDYGSGAGTPARLLAARLSTGGGRVTCVDISQGWLGTARKRLARFPNVEFRLGDIAEVEIPDASQDVVFVHFVIHDIPAGRRPHVVKHLARKLVVGGKLYVREPINVIAEDEIRHLMLQNGLSEVGSSSGELPLMGRTYEGIFEKGAR